MVKVKALSKSLKVGMIITNSDESMLLDKLSNMMNELAINYEKICYSDFENNATTIKNKYNILIVFGREIREAREKIIHIGFHQIFWNVNFEDDKSIFIASDKSDFNWKINLQLVELFETLMSEIKKIYQL